MDPSVDVLKALAVALAPFLATQGQKHTLPSGTPSTPYLHGPGGLFGVSGLERDVISTRIQPRGLASMLAAKPSNVMTPLFAYIMGFRDVSGDVANGVCDECEVAGPMKTCIQTAQFGRYCFNTREAEVNRIGQVNDRGEFLDLTLLNDPLVAEMGGLFPTLPAQNQILAGRELVERMLEVGVAFQNTLMRQLYTGNPANNSAGGGYKEFPGLDILIGTTKIDALTNVDCPGLDSDIKNFNYSRVGDPLAANEIVNVLTYMMRYLRHNASRGGFEPVDWRIVMRDDLFYEITAIWPCSYLSYRCATRDTAGIDPVPEFDTADAIQMRDDMRNGSYLIIDGVRYPVIIDDGILEYSSGDNNKIPIGCFSSDVYVIPMSVIGRVPVTFWQYFDYSAGTLPAIADIRAGSYYWTDGGRYLWHLKPPLNWCVSQIAKIEPRVLLLTPHLAGRITNVVYCPLQHTRDSHPDDDYWFDGGVYTPRAVPSYYNEWHGR